MSGKNSICSHCKESLGDMSFYSSRVNSDGKSKELYFHGVCWGITGGRPWESSSILDEVALTGDPILEANSSYYMSIS